MFLGIDVSVHNGYVNVKQIQEAGYEYMIVRAGYGKNNIDQRFESNAKACVNLNMPMGIYWFSYAYTVEMARNEAQYAIQAVKKYKNTCPIAYDFEYDSVRYARTKGIDITKTLSTQMAKAFLEEVKKAGFIPVLYTNNDYIDNYFNINEFSCDIWYARYKSALTLGEKELASIWQKSSTGKVNGIKGNVDINEFYKLFQSDLEEAEILPEKTININILNFQKAANTDGYRDQDSNKLFEDGIDGIKTRYVRKKVLLRAKNMDTKYVIGSTGELVIWWQTRLNEIGYSIKIDGKFGKDTRKRTLQMKKKYNLVADGIVGYNTISTSFYV